MIYVVLLNIDVKNWKCEDVRMNVKQKWKFADAGYIYV